MKRARKIFISYRRSDTENVAGRLYDAVKGTIGRDNLFKDVDSIDGGDNFAEVINETIEQADAVIALIGDEWVDTKDAQGRRRLDQEGDFVRLELATALRLRKRIIPLLVGDTLPLKAGDLPDELKELARLNALRLRPDPDFHIDVRRLLANLGYRRTWWKKYWLTVLVPALLVVALITYSLLPKGGPESQLDPMTPGEPIASEATLEYVEGVPVIPYDPKFLAGGHEVRLPTLKPEILEDVWGQGEVIDYLHFSLVMHEQRSLALYVAVNLDRESTLNVPRGRDNWVIDPRVPRGMQRENSLYMANPWDRGHLVSRSLISWTDSRVEQQEHFQMAVSFFPGTVPHHQNFNRSLWRLIELHVREDLLPEAKRAMVFIGPVFRDSDPLYRSTRIPRTFWQVFVAVDPQNPNLLTVHAFAADQYKSNELGEPLLDDGGEPIPTDTVRDFELQDYSISLRELTNMTGLDFGYLEQYDAEGNP